MNRRHFLTATAGALTATAGCTASDEEWLDELYFDTDYNKIHTDSNGQELNINIYSHAEDEEIALDSMQIEYREEGEDSWDVLAEAEGEEQEITMHETYSSEEPETYEFRSVVSSEDTQYVSQEETVTFLE